MFRWRMFYYIATQSARVWNDFIRPAIGVTIKFGGAPMRLTSVFSGLVVFLPILISHNTRGAAPGGCGVWGGVPYLQ